MCRDLRSSYWKRKSYAQVLEQGMMRPGGTAAAGAAPSSGAGLPAIRQGGSGALVDTSAAAAAVLPAQFLPHLSTFQPAQTDQAFVRAPETIAPPLPALDSSASSVALLDIGSGS